MAKKTANTAKKASSAKNNAISDAHKIAEAARNIKPLMDSGIEEQRVD